VSKTSLTKKSISQAVVLTQLQRSSHTRGLDDNTMIRETSMVVEHLQCETVMQHGNLRRLVEYESKLKAQFPGIPPMRLRRFTIVLLDGWRSAIEINSKYLATERLAARNGHRAHFTTRYYEAVAAWGLDMQSTLDHSIGKMACRARQVTALMIPLTARDPASYVDSLLEDYATANQREETFDLVLGIVSGWASSVRLLFALGQTSTPLYQLASNFVAQAASWPMRAHDRLEFEPENGGAASLSDSSSDDSSSDSDSD